jgi:TP901 family phage tail tape measure protein
MAFNINAQIILSQPKNLNNVTKQITQQLSKATNIQLKLGNTRQLNNIGRQLTTIANSFNKLNANLKSTRTSISALNSSFNQAASAVGGVAKAQSGLAAQTGRTNASLKQQSSLLGGLAGRFGNVAKQAIAFGLISRPIYDLQRALTGAVKDAVAFEKEIVKISQITGQSVTQLSNLTKQITQLSTSLGVGANELAETARIIAQTGRTAQETETILRALARSTLAPTFGKITDTTEGLVAALSQFNLKASDSEAVLGSLNKISKNFAVESEDLISAIRRTGGVFAQAAGQSKGTVAALQELSAIFTAVRSTTRESADTIAAGLRTIFSRIQRRGTIEFLKQFNIELTDAKGNFVGVFPAFDQLSKRLDTLIKQGDALTLSAIAEELGGIRQIGKLLPAIAQFDKARKALEDAQKGAVEGLGVDVAKGLDTIDNRLKRVRETFNQLIRTVFESDAFQNFTKNILTAAENFLKFGNSITQALEPILPLLTTLGAFKIGAGISGLLRGGGSAVSTVTGQASATANKQTATAAQKTAAATTTQNNLIINTNKILTNILNQVGNLSSNNSSGFNKVVSAINSRPIGGAIPSRRRVSGGSIPKFANGGPVHGPSHAAGGVIAELEGGEYVLPKFQRGTEAGNIRRELKRLTTTTPFDAQPGVSVRGKGLKGKTSLSVLKNTQAAIDAAADLDPFAAAFLRPGNVRSTFVGTNSPTEIRSALETNPTFKAATKGFGPRDPRRLEINKLIKSYSQKNKFKIDAGSLTQPSSEQLEDQILKGVVGTIKGGAKQLEKELGITGATNIALALKSANIDQIIGNIFESILSFAGVPFNPADPDPPNAPFDFPKGLRSKIAKKFQIPASIPTEAKSSFNEGNLSTLNKKVKNLNVEEAKIELSALLARGFAKKANGGEVPVRISNGEMVVTDPREVAANKGSLQKINKLAAGGFASGYVAKGPGTGKSDSIYTTLPAGAFVVNAASTKKFLGRARGGGVQKFVGGGQPTLNALVGAKDTAINNLVPRLKAFVGTQEQAAIAMKALTRATAQGATAGEALARAEFAVTQATAQETRAKERAQAAENKKLAATKGVTNQLNILKNAANKASGGAFFSGKQGKTAGGGGGGALGAVFALSSLTSTLGAADSALGKFAQQMTTVLFTLTAFSGLLPQGSIGAAKGVISTGLGGGAGLTGRFVGGAGFAGGSLGAGLAGGFIGKSIGDAIADAQFGQQQKIGRISGSETAGQAQGRAALGFGGAVAGGAIAGATIGSFLAPGIGTAIGAAIGAGGGAIVGALTTPFDAIGQQAAFQIAKDLKNAGDALTRSLNRANQEFNQITFGNFANEFDKQVNSITDALPGLAQQLYENGDLLKTQNGAYKDAISALAESLSPEQIQQASAQVDKGLENFVSGLSEQQLKGLSDTEGATELNRALISAAKSGTIFDKRVLKSRTVLAEAQAFTEASKLAERGQIQTSKVLIELARDFDFVNGSAEELQRSITESGNKLGLNAEELDAARNTIVKFASNQKEANAAQARDLIRRAQLNNSLQESAQIVDSFNLALDNAVKGLSQSLARSSEKFDLFAQRVSDIESGAAVARIDTGLSNRSNDEVISILERSTGQNLEAFRNLEQVQANLPNIIKNAVESIPETAGAEQATAAVLRSLQQQSGLAISGDFAKGLEIRIKGLVGSRQDEAGTNTILTGKALKEALSDETKLRELLGPVVQKQIDIFNGLVQESENLRKEFEKRINFEISRLQRVSAFEQSILEKRLANEDIVNGILQRNTNVIDKSLNILQRRISQVGGTSDLGALVSQRGQALAAKQQLEQQIALGDTSNETANALIKLTNQFANADKALKQFTEDTSFAASIQQEAARVQQGISGAAGGLDQIIGAAFGGDSEAVQGILRQVNVTERVLNGIGSLQDTFQVFSSAGNPIVKALADARFGAGGSETVQSALRFQLTQRLQGTPLGGIASGLLKNISDGSRDLATLAQRANSFAEQQISILTSIEAQNATAISAAQSGTDPFSQSVSTFSTAVQKFATTVASGGAGVFAGGAPVTRAAGGVIYRNQGGVSDGNLVGAFASRFSKGTDTIPAMLSPGEYVVRASAVRNVGVGTLDAINNSSVTTASTGGVIYRNVGGPVNFQKLVDKDLSKELTGGVLFQDFDTYLKGFNKRLSIGVGTWPGEYPPLDSIIEAVSQDSFVSDFRQLPNLFSFINPSDKVQPLGDKGELYRKYFKENYQKKLVDIVEDNIDKSAILNKSKNPLKNAYQGTVKKYFRTLAQNDDLSRVFFRNLGAGVDLQALFGGNESGPSRYAPLGYEPAVSLVSAINNSQIPSEKERKKTYKLVTNVLRQGVFYSGQKEAIEAQNYTNKAAALYEIDNAIAANANRWEQYKKFLEDAKTGNISGGFLGDIINFTNSGTQSFPIENYLEELTFSKYKSNNDVDVSEVINDLITKNLGAKLSIPYYPLMGKDLANALKINSISPITDPNSWRVAIANAASSVDVFKNFYDGLAKIEGKPDGQNTIYDQDALIQAVINNGAKFGIGKDLGASERLDNIINLYQSNLGAYNKAGITAEKKLSSLSSESALLQQRNFVGVGDAAYTYSDKQLEDHFDSDPFGGGRTAQLKNPDTGKPFSDVAVEAEIARRAGAAREAARDPKDVAREAREEKRQERNRRAKRAQEERREEQINKYNNILQTDDSLQNLTNKAGAVNAQINEVTAGIKDGSIPRESGLARLEKLRQLGAKFAFLTNQRQQNILRKVGLDKDPLLDRLTDAEKSAIEKYNTFVASGLGGKVEDFDKAEAIFRGNFAGGFTPNSAEITKRIQLAKLFYFGNAFADRPINLQKFHTGGLIGNFAQGGEVPIMAQKGEYVMSRKAVRQNGLGVLNAMNGGVVHKQEGGFLGRRSGGVLNRNISVSLDARNASALLQDSILNAGSSVNQLWSQTFTTFMEQFTQAVTPIQGLVNMPKEFTHTIQPVDVQGTDGITKDISANVQRLLMPMVEKIVDIVQGNNVVKPGAM